VTGYVPAATPTEAANVRTLVPMVLAGLKEPESPEGNPDVVKATLLLNPFDPVTVMVLLVLDPPATRAKLAGEAESEKLAVTVTCIGADTVVAPDLPATLIE